MKKLFSLLILMMLFFPVFSETIPETNASVNKTLNETSISSEQVSPQDIIDAFKFFKATTSKINNSLKKIADLKKNFVNMGFSDNQSLAILIILLLGICYILFKLLKIVAKWAAMIFIVWIILHILGFA